MYRPAHFDVTDTAQLQALIQAYGLGVVITRDLEASHLPLLLLPDRGPHGTLVGHMARSNPQWKAFDGEQEVLVVFSGPQGYVSPTWYRSTPQVPTWNYTAVHAYGAPRLVEDEAGLWEIMRASVEAFEAPLPAPWRMEDVPERFVSGLLKAVVGFEIPLARLEGKFKLSQNREGRDRDGVIEQLRARGDAASVELAAWMERAAAAPRPAAP